MSTLRAALFLVACSACNSVLGLDEFSIEPTRSSDAGARDVCSSSAQCETDATEPRACVRERCTTITSDDCNGVIGPYRDARAILIGSLFATSGPQAATNMARQRSAALAVEEINASGGIPAALPGAPRRPLALVTCDSEAALLRAGRHLIEGLGVPAIIGPNTSQDTLDLAKKLAIGSGTLLISPTAVAASITDLLDDDLSWLMVPTDAQRAPLLLHQLAALERQLESERDKPQLKLSIVFRDDALGQGTRAALNELEWSGRPLADPTNLNESITITAYDPTLSPQHELVRGQLQFAPDIVVLIGTAEAVTEIMEPLEREWSAGPRPHYVLIDSSKVPELLSLTNTDADLRARVRGTGVTAEASSRPVQEAFQRAFARRYPNQPATISGMGPAYDATYALAYALAATRELPIRGASIARGLRELGIGATMEVGSPQLTAAFDQLESGAGIRALGTSGPLQWDEHGAVHGGTIEVWCVGSSGGAAVFASGGVRYDIASREVNGSYIGCAATVTPPGSQAPVDMQQPSSAAAPAADQEPAAPPGGVATDAADGGAGSASADASTASERPAAAPQPAVPTAVDIGVSAQYRAFNVDPRDDVISPALRLTNRSASDGIELSSIRLRYYFTNEHAELCPAGCVVELSWAGILPGGSTVRARSHYVAAGDGGAAYLEVSFPPNAPRLELDQYVEVQQQFHTTPYRAFDETDDYSFDRRRSSFADSDQITAHQQETLIWGTPPK
jgi:ABC-type branched-subunit amino acid transport system substrate-binding protein